MEELERQFSDKALEDFRLIDEAVQNNDEKAYAKLLQRYKRPVYHMILKMVRNVDDAEDLTIESKKISRSAPGCSGLPPITPLIKSERRNSIP